MRLKNYIAIVLDKSGSMWSIEEAVVRAYNAQIEKIKEATGDQETMVSFYVFSNLVHTVYFNADAATAPSLRQSEYKPAGSTALFDAVGTAIEMFEGVPDARSEHVSFLVVSLTDGEENASTKWGDRTDSSRLTKKFSELQATDRWTFAFLLPPGTGDRFSRQFGIPSDNIREWEATRKGVKVAAVATQEGLGQYFAARKSGQRSVASFYATTDLSGVNRQVIQAKLKDISGYFKVYEVPKECRIDEFVAEKSKRPYVVGSGYYQLMKKELIQPKKKVLIMEKGQRAIWGGAEARELIGLPDGVDAKVTPGNHSNYDIFVQSKAPNRKLPRGTRVIYDPSHTEDSDATWDYQTAYAAAEAKRQAAGQTT